MKPARVATTFSRTLHLSSSSRALATLNSQNLSVAQPTTLSEGKTGAGRTYPIRNISTAGGFGKARLRCSFSCLSLSKRHELSSCDRTAGSETEENGEFQLTEILYVANGQFKIQTTSTTATAAKELQLKILPRVNIRGEIN